MNIDERLKQLGIILPEPFKAPSAAKYPFVWLRRIGNRGIVSGHLPLAPDGSLAEPRGKVGADLTLEQGQAAARLVALSMLATIRRELGSLDRVAGWARVFGMVNVAPAFQNIPGVINGFSNTLIEVFGEERGMHARSAVGMANLPFDVAVEVEAEIVIAD
jgi:enamine deaminase RidA (YjgF/YER057c/UK114 family)